MAQTEEERARREARLLGPSAEALRDMEVNRDMHVYCPACHPDLNPDLKGPTR